MIFASWRPQDDSKKLADLTSTDIVEIQKKADSGDASAQFALAEAYDFGNGAAQSDKNAFLWYRKSADQGFAPAQNSLGFMYRTGKGVEQNKEQAVAWYRKAAKQGNAKAMFNLGTAYFNGDGVSIDDIAAYAWFTLARGHGSAPASDAVSRMSNTLAQWQTSAALEKIGDFYEQGSDLAPDHKLAIDWYRKAAQLGEAPVRVKLAKFLLDQHDSQQYPEALHLCEDAGKQMYSPGALCAGLLYREGMGTTKNLQAATRWITKSAELGNAQAMYQLGEMYWAGSGVNQDKIVAYSFMLLAATGDSPKAQQDKATYEQALSSKEVEKGRKRAETWAKQHPVLRLMQVPPSK
jgi:TPR repeat protein